MVIKTVTDDELNRILSLKTVHDRILLAMYAQKDRDNGHRQPPEVLRNQCSLCHYYAVECIKGSEYEPEDVWNRNCARFSMFNLENWDSLT
jgi:hypothetical protein